MPKEPRATEATLRTGQEGLPPPVGEYVVYGGQISLFTRKLESALRFYGVPFRTEAKSPENGPLLEKRAATHQVPILQTPEDWMIADTTPILGLLDARFPARRLFPLGPLGVLVHIVEEILDEWIARTMVHYRWHYPENTRYVVSMILGREVSSEEARELPIAKWGPRACRATGTDSEHQREQACHEEAQRSKHQRVDHRNQRSWVRRLQAPRQSPRSKGRVQRKLGANSARTSLKASVGLP